MNFLWALVVLLIPIVFLIIQFSPKAVYKIKLTIFLLGVGVIAIISLPFIVFRPRDYRNCIFPTWLCVHFARVLGITMEVCGTENIKLDHGNVLIMNHQSAFDLIAIAHIWPLIGNITSVAKKELLYIPFFGIGLWFSGFLFIDRKNRTDSINILNKESKAINERNCKILVFPEGTRNSSDTLLPFKKGAFHMAIRRKCPIQPIIVTKYQWIDDIRSRSNHAVIHIMPEISTENYKNENVGELMELCYHTMQRKYNEVNGKH